MSSANLRWAALLFLCRAACPAAQPLDVRQTNYEVRVAESVEIAVPPDTLDFLLKAKSLRLSLDAEAVSLVVGPNRTHDRILLAAPLRIPPGDYTATLSATSPTNEERTTKLAISVKPRQSVPSGGARPPVVLLNGWETGFTGTCTVSTSSADTFGNLAQYLVSD